jgi:hypothetical protein
MTVLRFLLFLTPGNNTHAGTSSDAEIEKTMKKLKI